MSKVAKAPAIKAFTVLESTEGTGGIVFARHSVVARREGAAQFGDGDFRGVTCTRTPWADRYAETGDVPVGEMIEMGWHFECGNCGKRIDADYLGERGWRFEDVIGTQHSTVYCNEVCDAREKLHRAEAAYHQRRWIRRFQAFVKRRFPDAVLVPGEGISSGSYAYATKRHGRWVLDSVAVSFEFPGMRIAPATLRYDRKYPDQWTRPPFLHAKPNWSCCYGDKEAFEAYAASTRPIKGDPA